MNSTSDSIASNADAAKNHALASYVLMLVGMFTVVPVLLGAVWAMVKRRDALGTVYHSHYTNAIRVFWYTLAWSILGALLIYLLIGYAILLCVWLWSLYRLVNGLLKISANKPYPL